MERNPPPVTTPRASTDRPTPDGGLKPRSRSSGRDCRRGTRPTRARRYDRPWRRQGRSSPPPRPLTSSASCESRPDSDVEPADLEPADRQLHRRIEPADADPSKLNPCSADHARRGSSAGRGPSARKDRREERIRAVRFDRRMAAATFRPTWREVPSRTSTPPANVIDRTR